MTDSYENNTITCNNDNDNDNSDVSFDFLFKIPKVELHAHLNGCIRPSTLVALAQEKGVVLSSLHFSQSSFGCDTVSSLPSDINNNSNDDDYEEALMYNTTPRSLQDCFDMFDEIKQCVNDLQALERITWEALEDFAAHRVVYLELRTTPKDFTQGESDKRDYLLTVLSVMERFEQLPVNTMTCRLLVAIDRSWSEAVASETVDVTISLFNKDNKNSRIVGMDVGGNPVQGDFMAFRPHLERARRAGLRLTVHCGEVPCDDDSDNNQYYQEAQAIVDFEPDRLGHALMIPSSLRLSERRIPVETCPTSNVMTLELSRQHGRRGHLIIEGLVEHPQLAHWLATDYPLAICTDDPGVFDTTLTRELWLLCRAFHLDRSRICRLVMQSMEYAFCDVKTKQQLQKSIQQEMNSLLLT